MVGDASTDSAKDVSAASRARWSVFRILWRIIVVLSVLFTGGSAIQAGLTALLIQCWDDKIDLPSPDGKHVARSRVHRCEGPTMFSETIWQVVDLSRTGEAGMTRIFESDRDGSEIRWDDSEHLRIDIRAMVPIGLSLHQESGIRIAYHVPRRVMSLQWLDDQDRHADEMHRTRQISDADYEFLKQENRRIRLSWPERFIQWAHENAIIDDDGK